MVTVMQLLMLKICEEQYFFFFGEKKLNQYTIVTISWSLKIDLQQHTVNALC